jgi:two-component system response regulator MprA
MTQDARGLGSHDDDEARLDEGGALHVLVVDGDVASGRVTVRMLRDDGFRVELATDGGLAIARLSRDPLPSVLLTDLHLPGADGSAVARYARSRSPGMAIFFVTARPELAKGHEHELSPPAAILPKPVDYEALSRRIGALAQR